MITTIPLLPGITLRCFNDNRFKQGCLSVQFLRPACKEEAAMNALIPAVLLRGCQSAPDLRHITLRLDDLYGASMGALVRRIGDYQTTGLYCGFIADRYTMDGDAVLAPMVKFLGEILFQPVLEKGIFREDFVESEKKNLIAAIQSQKNDKRSYCVTKLLRTMCKDDPFGIPRLGEAAWVEDITPEALFTQYQKVLRESRVELFYVGESAPEQVADLLKSLFSNLNRSYVNQPEQSDFHDAGKEDCVETMEIAQGKLAMGFVTPITLRDPQLAAMQVCNTILGAGMTSKLFMNIREKQSLCYDIGSGYHGVKGILFVSAGIDCDKVDHVKQEILLQLESIRQGEISDNELLAAKEGLISGLRGSHDSPSAIEGYYATGAVSGLGWTPEKYMEEISKVTAQQVRDAAKTLQLHSTYFLKGVK